MTDAGVEPARTVLDDRYELGAVLGGGSTAEVFRAYDHVLERAVAVKVLAPVGDDPARALGQERELTALAALDHHPGLITLLDAGSVGGRTFLVMELVEGDSLGRVLAGRPIHAPAAVGAGRDVAEALVGVHARGITHCDVTPGNVLVRHDGRAVLSDFGTALPPGCALPATPGAVSGTPAYMAPEQVSPASAGGPVGPASDVYALGLVVLEALTGRQEFTGAITEAAVARLFRDPDVPVLPAGLTPLLRHMTALRPGDRPTAREARVALDVVLAALVEPGGAATLPAVRGWSPHLVTTGPGSTGPGSTGAGSTAARRPVLLASAAAMLAVAVGLGAWWTTDAPAVPPAVAVAVLGAPGVPVVGAPIVPQPAASSAVAVTMPMSATPPAWVTALATVGAADRVVADPDAHPRSVTTGSPRTRGSSGSARDPEASAHAASATRSSDTDDREAGHGSDAPDRVDDSDRSSDDPDDPDGSERGSRDPDAGSDSGARDSHGGSDSGSGGSGDGSTAARDSDDADHGADRGGDASVTAASSPASSSSSPSPSVGKQVHLALGRLVGR